MIIIYNKSFTKLFDEIKDKTVVKRANNAIQKLKSANTLREVTNIVPMEDHPGFYRIRFGDFRIGFFNIEGEPTVELLDIDHRNDFYRKFPRNFA